jgi:hypothetical protein
LGGADFFGGLGSKHLGSMRVTWLSMMTGVVGFFLYFLLSGGSWLTQASPAALALGGISGFVLAFAIVTESVFAWPGMGKLIIDSIQALDRPVMVGYLMLVALLFTAINLVADLLYALLDPRLRSRRT